MSPTFFSPPSIGLRAMVTRGVLLTMLLSLLPGLLLAQRVADETSSPGTSPTTIPSTMSPTPPPIPTVPVILNVTEFRRVMPDTPLGAEDHWTQLHVEGLSQIPPWSYQFTLYLFYNDSSQTRYQTKKELAGEDEMDIVFEHPLPDDKTITNEVLEVYIDSPTKMSGFFRGYFHIEDLKARVAVVDGQYARVTPGNLGNVTDGKAVCENDDNTPCYFSEEDLLSFPPEIERCTTLYSKGETLEYCDDTVSEFRPLAQNLTLLLLLDETHLHLRYEEMEVSVEVLLLDSEGKRIPEEPSLDCHPEDAAAEGKGCEMEVTIPEGTEVVIFTVVSVNDYGYVEGSTSYPFQFFEVDALRLTTDAVMTKWVSAGEEEFDINIRKNKELDDYIYQMTIKCGSPGQPAVPCESFFVKLGDVDENYIAAVQKGINAIAKTIPKELPEQSSISKISNTDESGVIITTFMVKGDSQPQSSKMIEVTINDKEVTDQPIDGEVVGLPDGFEYRCTENILKSAEEKQFLVLEYSDTAGLGNITRAGAAYIEFLHINVQLDWMANTSCVREMVLDERNTTIGEEPCSILDSPCYVLTDVPKDSFVPVCINITNQATKQELEQCEDHQPTSPPELSLTKVQLQEGDLTSNLSVTAQYLNTTHEVDLVLFINDKIEGIQYRCNLENGTCVADLIPLPDSTFAVNALVVCTDEIGLVTETTIAQVEHLSFIKKKLTDESLMVYWIACNADEYIAELIRAESQKFNTLIVSDETITSDILCNGNACYATFHHLSPDLGYFLSVHKKDDLITAVEEAIEPLKDISDEGQTVNIAVVSKISNDTTEVTLKEGLSSTVQISVSLSNDAGKVLTEESGKGMPVDQYKKVFTFSHDVPIFSDAREAVFTVLSVDGMTILQKATADLYLQKLDASLAWVGASSGSKSASLRVDTNSQESVLIGKKTCLKVDSPCYYIEDSTIPKNLENCVELEVVLQCNKEITPYIELLDIIITQSGENLEVEAPVDASDDVLEVKIYDPENTNIIFSIGSATCNSQSGEKGITVKCMQPLRIPNDRRSVNVIVTEISPGGMVLKSNLVSFSFPTTGTETWVIVVSVLGSVAAAAILTYMIVVLVKKKKSRKWESDKVERELDAISEISQSQVSNGPGGFDHHEPSPLRRDYDRYHHPPHQEASRQYSRQSVSPQPSLKTSKKFPSSYTNAFGSPDSYGHDNKGYSPSPHSEEGAAPLPRVLPRAFIGPNKMQSSSLYQRTQL